VSDLYSSDFTIYNNNLWIYEATSLQSHLFLFSLLRSWRRNFASITLCNKQKIVDTKILTLSYFWGAEHDRTLQICNWLWCPRYGRDLGLTSYCSTNEYELRRARVAGCNEQLVRPWIQQLVGAQTWTQHRTVVRVLGACRRAPSIRPILLKGGN